MKSVSDGTAPGFHENEDLLARSHAAEAILHNVARALGLKTRHPNATDIQKGVVDLTRRLATLEAELERLRKG
jgi:hypothetical protein